LHGLDDRGVAVAEDHRPPRTDVVDVPGSVRVPEIRALRALHETWRAADGTECTHRRIHAAGNEHARAIEQLLVAGHGGSAALFSAWCHGRACRSLAVLALPRA